MTKYNLINTSTDYTGFRFKRENELVIIDVFFPHGYQEVSEKDRDFKQNIKNLIRTINLAKTSENNIKIGDEFDDDIPLFSYIYLAEDYLNYGLYKDAKRKYLKKITGKINWKRTLRTKYYIEDDTPIYLDLVREKNIEKENIITEVQKYCLNEIEDIIGNLIEPLPKFETSLEKKDEPSMIRILKRELRETNEDRKQMLINEMIKIIKDKSGSSNKTVRKFGTYKYHYAWEKMIDYLYGDYQDEKNPIFTYHINDDEIKHKLTLKPDTINSKIKNKIFLIDSKYYTYGISKSGSLPDSASIQKQITYEKYIKRKNKDKKIYNIFIMPYDKNNNRFKTSDNYHKIGYINSNIKKDNDYIIEVYLADTKNIIDNYCNNKKDNELFDIIVKTSIR